LDLAYSISSDGFYTNLLNGIVIKAISEIDFPGKVHFQEAAAVIAAGKFETQFDATIAAELFEMPSTIGIRRFSIMLAPFENHIAYFVTEYDQNNHPMFLSYIDGNCPLGGIGGSEYGYGEVRFMVANGEMLKSLEEFEEGLKQKFAGPYLDPIQLRDRLSEVVLLGTMLGSIPLTRQTRRNCPFKSLTALLRVAISKLHPDIKFGQYIPEGDGVDMHKGFKKALVTKYFTDLTQPIVGEQNLRAQQGFEYEKPIWFDNAINCVRRTVKKAADKWAHHESWSEIPESEIPGGSHRSRFNIADSILKAEENYAKMIANTTINEKKRRISDVNPSTDLEPSPDEPSEPLRKKEKEETR
jgi:hypothetical protein